MSEPLLPCPFCGAAEARVYGSNTSAAGQRSARTYFYAICGHCHASTNVLLADRAPTSQEAAVDAWNRRTSAWIGVEEWMPEEGLEVFVLHSSGRTSVGGWWPAVHPEPAGFWSQLALLDGEGIAPGDDKPVGPVTHWAPRPASPLGRTDGGRISPAAVGMEKIGESDVSVPAWPLPEAPK